MTAVVRGYKTELDLNNEQRTACLKHAGCARFAYNWGLARAQEIYHTTGKRPTAIDLHKQLNALKSTDFPWMNEAVRTTGSSSGSDACGVGSAGLLDGVGETSHVEAGTKRCLGMS